MTSAKEKQSSSDATGSRLPWQVMAVALIGAASLLPPAAAQPQPRKYGPNDEVSDGTYVYKIIRCQGDDQWDECEYQAYRDGVAAGSKGRMTIRNLRAAEQRVLDARRRAEGPGARGPGAAPLGDSAPVANRIAPTPAACRRRQTLVRPAPRPARSRARTATGKSVTGSK
jgi:hypothetical protein